MRLNPAKMKACNTSMARLRSLFAQGLWIWKPAFASPATLRCWGRNWRGRAVPGSQKFVFAPLSFTFCSAQTNKSEQTLAGYDSSMSSSHPPFSEVAAARVVSFEEARHLVEQHAESVCPGEVETVDLLAGLGRVLAEEILADRDFPPFARATRDGYAVRAADLAEVPARLEVVGEVKAGDWPEPGLCSVGHGQAVGIMTGAPLPAGADAVVMVEHTALAHSSHPKAAKNVASGWGTLEGKFVDIQRRVSSGENFVPLGAEARAGQLLLDRGRRLDHAGIAIAASVGKSQVQVFRRPRVAVLSTGDEVVEIDAMLAPAQIRNSNSYSLAAQVVNVGGEAVRLAIAPDSPGRLRALIEEGFECDLLLLTGGV